MTHNYFDFINYTDAKPTLKNLQYMDKTSRDGGTIPFRLMARITPRVTQLAIALNFPQHIIANLKTETDPVYYLFSEWLRGANQEHDPRPLTWGTLITALQHAGVMEEVKILEEHFIAPVPPSVSEREGMLLSKLIPVHGIVSHLRLFVTMASLVAETKRSPWRNECVYECRCFAKRWAKGPNYSFVLLCLGGRSHGAYGSLFVYVYMYLSVGRISGRSLKTKR